MSKLGSNKLLQESKEIYFKGRTGNANIANKYIQLYSIKAWKHALDASTIYSGPFLAQSSSNETHLSKINLKQLKKKIMKEYYTYKLPSKCHPFHQAHSKKQHRKENKI